MSKKLGTLVNDARLKKGLSMAALADQVEGLSSAMVGRIERGEAEPSEDVLRAMAKVLGVTQKSLVDAASGTGAAAKTSTAKSTSSKSTSSKSTSAKSTAAKSTTAKKTTSTGTSKTASKAKSSSSKSSSSGDLKLTATEKKLVEAYRKANTNAKKTALSVLEGKATMADFMTLMLADKAGGALTGGSGSGSGKKNDLDLSDLGTLLSGTLGKFGKK